jgi:hypothetical protein
MLAKPGLDLRDLAYEVREEVARIAKTAGYDQHPEDHDGTVGGRVYLAGLPQGGGQAAKEPAKPAGGPQTAVAMTEKPAAPADSPCGVYSALHCAPLTAAQERALSQRTVSGNATPAQRWWWCRRDCSLWDRRRTRRAALLVTMKVRSTW